MKIIRIAGFTLVFLFVVAGWIFVVGILRYGSVEDFGVRIRRAVASSRPPAEVLLPPPSLDNSTSLAARLTALPPSPTKTAAPATQNILPTKTPRLATVTPPADAATDHLDATPADLAASVASVTLPDENPLVADAPRSVALTGLRHEWQTWNNCGPATLATYLSYYGDTLGQAQIGSALRRSEDDKNVSPEELHDYAAARGMRAILRVNGDSEMLRLLVSNGYPVLIETWLEEAANDGMGHYRLVTGFDDDRQAWIFHDSYVSSNLVEAGGKDGVGDYAGIWLDYATAEAWWKVFNRTWLLVYPPEDEATIQILLGDKLAADQWLAAETQAHADIALDSADAFAWFNLGTSLWNQGRVDEAVTAFDQARAIGLPWRMLWYQFGIFPAYLSAGRPNDTLALADATLANTTTIEEIHYWRGRALAALDNTNEARSAYQRALALYSDYPDALSALAELQ